MCRVDTSDAHLRCDPITCRIANLVADPEVREIEDGVRARRLYLICSVNTLRLVMLNGLKGGATLQEYNNYTDSLSQI
ncbi:hypothetical protein AWB80_03600 [Caballeronia pedi]|uniref:Uncharacterized protein n=1 Tax=Caballeronia pedi TaxID=1777141 RepID=A0A158BI65_9BURK|nr:hypothetical protein AWB80_03600 [Caballeronia pedi]